MRFYPSVVMICAFVAVAPAVAASKHDQNINAVYAQVSSARLAGDVQGMSSAFAPDALLVDTRPGPAISGAELAARLEPMTAKMRSEGVKVETAYRIERRSIIGDLALDAGFMRQRMTRPDGQTSERYARFLVTMQRDQGGKWRIVGDASMPAEKKAFDEVPRQDTLYFAGD